ncbi:cell division protein FtsQ/DivIB [Pseudoroseicyclus tamaricis]|uniref:Cell division protein FtsQ n=1 Tax=Pseudoroseicyclus tamaricis TaxID=2705421 RepID=A0A6B2K114_9RHOB|nr:cell division protein FtsQ/DivIB [Pseudoroseicyclus tamaricis]NDV01392.1 cell division protein FtsQ [Pseudoroseicyclus tamaricis]
MFAMKPPARRDPAPSRLGYRFHRLWLTPLFRIFLRVILPVFALFLISAAYVADDENWAAIEARYTAVVQSFQERPEFMVTGVDIRGADIALAAAINGLLPFEFPVTSFAIDLGGLKEEITALTAVKEARLRVQTGGTLRVDVTQRRPVAIWRHVDGLRLVDADGVLTGMVPNRTDRPDLPLIAGDGARESTVEAMALFAAAEPIMPRVRGLVRMGERRWDLVLDRGQRILLPEEGAVPALERVLALHEAQRMLDLDIVVVDMRSAARPTVRLSTFAEEHLRTVAERRQ